MAKCPTSVYDEECMGPRCKWWVAGFADCAVHLMAVILRQGWQQPSNTNLPLPVQEQTSNTATAPVKRRRVYTPRQWLCVKCGVEFTSCGTYKNKEPRCVECTRKLALEGRVARNIRLGPVHLRQERLARGFRIYDLAAMTALSPSTVGAIETYRQVATPDDRRVIAAALNMTVEAIWPSGK